MAQSVTPTVKAYIEPDSILIGDRFTLTIDVEKDQVQSLFFPAFSMGEQPAAEDDMPQFGTVECLEDHPVDTLERKGRRLLLRKRYTLTAFDEGVYNMGRPSVLYADKNIVDTLYGVKDSLLVVVNTFKIDSTAMLCDIKPVKTLPFKFGEISGYLTILLAILAILALAVYLLARYLAKRGKKISDLFKPEPPLPPHIVAITALENLQNQKLWQNNRHKEYYSALSEIVRTYLDGRFGVGAMEMSTDEIVEAIKEIDLPQKSVMDLVSVLRDADLVKFAKAIFEASENESAYSKIYYFVEETKPVEELEEEEVK
jgi:DNA-binding transcriptional ArsR family regulator